MEKVCVIFCTSESFCASWRRGRLSSPRKFICQLRTIYTEMKNRILLSILFLNFQIEYTTVIVSLTGRGYTQEDTLTVPLCYHTHVKFKNRILKSFQERIKYDMF